MGVLVFKLIRDHTHKFTLAPHMKSEIFFNKSNAFISLSGILAQPNLLPNQHYEQVVLGTILGLKSKFVNFCKLFQSI